MAATKSTAAIIARGTSNAAFTQLTGASATRTGTTATLTKTSHGLSNGDKVLIQGFSLEEFNGVFTVANSAANTFDYTIKQDPGANPTGTPGTVDKVTLGTALDISTAYGGNVMGGIQNTTTGPTVAPQLWMGIAGANNEYDYIWRQVSQGDTTANSLTPFVMALGLGMSFVNFAVCRNTGQAVDCQLQATYVTAV
jgi:hypothetical protein